MPLTVSALGGLLIGRFHPCGVRWYRSQFARRPPRAVLDVRFRCDDPVVNATDRRSRRSSRDGDDHHDGDRFVIDLDAPGVDVRRCSKVYSLPLAPLRGETASQPVYASLSSSVRYLGASAFTFSMNAA
jgi:hypothetical protein